MSLVQFKLNKAHRLDWLEMVLNLFVHSIVQAQNCNSKGVLEQSVHYSIRDSATVKQNGNCAYFELTIDFFEKPYQKVYHDIFARG